MFGETFLLYRTELPAPIILSEHVGPGGIRTRDLAIKSRCSSTRIREHIFQMNYFLSVLLFSCSPGEADSPPGAYFTRWFDGHPDL